MIGSARFQRAESWLPASAPYGFRQDAENGTLEGCAPRKNRRTREADPAI